MAGARSESWEHLPLLAASERGEEELVLSLIAEGCSVNQRTEDGWTALIMAAKEGHERIVRQLLDAGAEANPPEVGHTALRGAAIGGHIRCVQILLCAKASSSPFILKKACTFILSFTARVPIVTCHQVTRHAGGY